LLGYANSLSAEITTLEFEAESERRAAQVVSDREEAVRLAENLNATQDELLVLCDRIIQISETVRRKKRTFQGLRNGLLLNGSDIETRAVFLAERQRNKGGTSNYLTTVRNAVTEAGTATTT